MKTAITENVASVASTSLVLPLRVWWVPQMPMEPFHVEVDSLPEARKILDTLAAYAGRMARLVSRLRRLAMHPIWCYSIPQIARIVRRDWDTPPPQCAVWVAISNVNGCSLIVQDETPAHGSWPGVTWVRFIPANAEL